MAFETISPNMNLVLPGVGATAGPQYATDINASLSIIDGHDHSTGAGVQITPSGLNINADLPFNSNNAVSLRTTRFTDQTTLLSLPADLSCLYSSNGDLYFNDGVGNQVRITQSGAVAGTPGSIANLVSPASATYVALDATFVWQSDVNKPANMDFASAILRNLTTNSKGLTLAPPNAMAADYSIVLPSLPVSTSFLQIDGSGNITAAIAVSMGITASNIANQTITATQIANLTITDAQLASNSVTNSKILNGAVSSTKIDVNAITTPQIVDLQVTTAKLANGAVTAAKLDSANYTITSGSGVATTSSTLYNQIPNQNASITLHGRPYIALLTAVAGSAVASIPPSDGTLQFLRNGTPVATFDMNYGITPGVSYYEQPSISGSISIQATYKSNSGATVTVNNVQLVVYET